MWAGVDAMSRLLAALISGLLFGLGLTISGMINPAKVIGFLDIAGRWDPSLAFVVASAIPVTAVGFAFARRRSEPMCASAFSEPSKTRVDTSLVLGAVSFGLGWGLVGYCPGPALASLGLADWRAPLFVVAMLIGMGAYEMLNRITPARRQTA